MKKFKCLLNRISLSILFVCLGISSIAQLAGGVDTTFAPNNNGIPFSTSGYYRSMGVEVVGNSVYYAFSSEPGFPKIRKYDFQGNEDESWYSNQMSTWSTQFATTCLEPEKNQNGDYTGEFFIGGRNSYNSMSSQGVRFLNKINSDGTRDLNFVCPITSWISVCSAIYQDWENQKLYFSYRNGYGTVVIACCDQNTGVIFQTFTIPSISNNFDIRKITKIPGTNDIVAGGTFDFTINGQNYVGMFRLDSQFNVLPINGITGLAGSFSISDILFVNSSECDGTLTGSMKVYLSGGISQISGVSNLRNIARFDLSGNNWIIDSNYNPGCSGYVADICYYNCHLIATGNFASSMPKGNYAPTWSPKVTAFTSDGLLSDEFKMLNTGSGLGGVYLQGFENNFGQGDGRCLAVNSNDDGNDRWEIFIGGTFVNLISGPQQPRNVLKHVNFMAKLYGFNSNIDSRFDYCLEEGDSDRYSISTFEISNTNGCEKWSLYESDNVSNWNLIRTELSHDFTDTTLLINKWYKLTRTVTECGNSCSSSYIIYKESQNCQTPNSGVELRQLVINSESDNIEIKQIEMETDNLQIFPNPSNGIITVTDNFKDEFRNISLYNSIGSKVFNNGFNSNNYRIDFTELPSGVYMLVITTDIGVQRQQIIKE